MRFRGILPNLYSHINVSWEAGQSLVISQITQLFVHVDWLCSEFGVNELIKRKSLNVNP